jgi:hypothetical protein
VLQANGGGRMAALTSYAAPWPLGMWWWWSLRPVLGLVFGFLVVLTPNI